VLVVGAAPKMADGAGSFFSDAAGFSSFFASGALYDPWKSPGALEAGAAPKMADGMVENCIPEAAAGLGSGTGFGVDPKRVDGCVAVDAAGLSVSVGLTPNRPAVAFGGAVIGGTGASVLAVGSGVGVDGPAPKRAPGLVWKREKAGFASEDPKENAGVGVCAWSDEASAGFPAGVEEPNLMGVPAVHVWLVGAGFSSFFSPTRSNRLRPGVDSREPP
jgi:hypothetical protein